MTATARPAPAVPGPRLLPARGPERVLIVSADIGGGHHATGRGLEAAVRARWPEAAVEWVDTLAAMRAGPAFRGIYRANVEWTPWLYDFFYDQIDRRRWFARASKAVTSAWAGRRLAPVIAAARPDLILSTYPLGSGGLAWLRRRGRLDVPVGAWVSDFAPHPFWVYEDLDLHLVMHDAVVPLAHRAEPGAPVLACAGLPVVPDFRPGDASGPRRELGLRPDAFVALVSCGVYAFGAVTEAVDVLLAAGGERLQVVVACGRNDALRRALERRPEAGERLFPLGWTDRMPEVTRAADVVVTNAGGATSLEALATGRPVLMFRPIAGHGRANAEAMAEAGVALLCRDGDELAGAVRRLLDEDDDVRPRLEARARAAADSGEPSEDVARLLARPPVTARPLSATDEFFALVDSPDVPQHVAALALLRPDGTPVTAEVIGGALAATVPDRPWLTWRLERRPGRRPRWLTGRGSGPDALPVRDALLDGVDPGEYFSGFVARRFPPDAPAWEVEMASRWPDGRTAMLIRAHHSFGDGLAVLDAFTGITTSRPTPAPQPPRPVRPAPDPAPDGKARRPRSRELGLSDARQLLRGLVSLARAGAAPPSPLHAPRSGGEPARHAFAALPVARIRAAAKAAELSTSDLVVGLVAETVHRFLAERGTPAPRGTVRAMVPRTLRRAASVDGPGNRTVALRVDLPVGDLPPAERMRQVRAVIGEALACGQMLATAVVMGLAARLPVRLYQPVARWLYRSAWFDLIVSVIPGPRGQRWFADARVEQAYAVLPLAQGVGLAVGAMFWDDVLTVSITYDPVLLPDGDRLAALLPAALEVLDGG